MRAPPAAPQVTPVSGDIPQELLNDVAELTSANAATQIPFENAMNSISSYKDIIAAAQDTVSQMKNAGIDIKDLIAQAQQGGISEDLIDKMQQEVNEKIMDISIIKEAAESNGVNNSEEGGQYEINIPDMEALTGMSGDSIINAISSGISSYDLDISFDMDGVSFNGSAKIAMGMGADGSFKFAFDVSLDYNLSGLTGERGITSEQAPAIIDKFLGMLNGADGTFANANKILDTAFEKIFEQVNSAQSTADSYGNFASSAAISRQIVQQSSQTMDSIMMNNIPNIALAMV